MPYIELHCHSNYSFLDGASHPDELAEKARALGMPALALSDHDGLYGAVRFRKACLAAGVRPILGAEMTLESGHHLTLLARDNAGWSNLCRLVTIAHRGQPKGQARLSFGALAENASGLVCLTGCRRGEIASNILARRFPQALAAARRYLDIFGPDALWMELQHHQRPDDSWLCAAQSRLAARLGVGCVATNNVHYHDKGRQPLQDVLVSIRTLAPLDKPHPLRRPNDEYYLKTHSEMSSLFHSFPEAIENTERIAEQCNVDLDFSAYRFPPFPVPDTETAFSYLFRLTEAGARERYRPLTPQVLSQIAHELGVIERLGLSEYFLIVWDIVRYARERGILAQGRGSAANSIVAYCLGITNVDPIRLDLLFERFLSAERAGTPDIDIDFANSRREEVIQYVYQKYGADHTAMACAVVTFQARSALRDVGKALGIPLGLLDRLGKRVDHHRAGRLDGSLLDDAGLGDAASGYQWEQLFDLCHQIDGFPRHLSIHVGGMLITARPLIELVPLEPATMPDRVVCQFDKDDIEDVGLVKIDILGLGMLSLVQDAVQMLAADRDIQIDLATLPLDDPKVYELMCSADTVGVFQIESRAQMQTLPRLQPRDFYDIITEIAIIRPGPIQGQMVHPFIRRKQAREEVTYLHPCLEPVLKKTMGVCLFQEQVIKVAMVAAGFSPGEADLLRRAMGSHRSHEKMERLRVRFIAGAVEKGMTPEVGEAIFSQLSGFASYGFPESHAAAFAKIVYDSAYLKVYHAPEFYCALLNNWPMGFYHPSVVVGDAKRHRVPVLPVSVNHSHARCTVEKGAVRLGYRYVHGIGEAVLPMLDAAAELGPYTSLHEFCQRTRLDQQSVESLVTIGAFDCLGTSRRQLLWQVPEAVQAARAGELPDITVAAQDVPFGPMPAIEEARADYQFLGLSANHHVIGFYREALDEQAVLRCDELAAVRTGNRVRVAGAVICRQRPPTAKGHVFLTIEDETGMVNAIVRPATYQQYHEIARHELAIIIEGIVQNQDGALSVLALRLESIGRSPMAGPKSRNFH